MDGRFDVNSFLNSSAGLRTLKSKIDNSTGVPSTMMLAHEGATVENVLCRDNRAECGDDGNEFIVHKVSPRDTILGLSLKYGCNAQTILLANDLPTSGNANLSLLPSLKIPRAVHRLSEPGGEMSQRAILRAFRAKHGLPEEESKYYLLEASWDLEKAGDLLREHLRFEAASGGYSVVGKDAPKGSGGVSFPTSHATVTINHAAVGRKESTHEGIGGRDQDAIDDRGLDEDAPLIKAQPGALRRRKG